MLFIPPLLYSQSSLPSPGVWLPPEKKLLEALHPPPLFFLPAAIFLGKPSPTLLFTHQQSWLAIPPAASRPM